MLTEGFNPYDELQELKRFAQHADTHLHNLLKNEKQFIIAINSVTDRLEKLEARIKLLEGTINELYRMEKK